MLLDNYLINFELSNCHRVISISFKKEVIVELQLSVYFPFLQIIII